MIVAIGLGLVLFLVLLAIRAAFIAVADDCLGIRPGDQDE